MSKLKTQNQKVNIKSDVKIRSYHFSILILEFISYFPQKKVYWSLGDQLMRSATSIGSNIVEAKSSSSKREFIKYYDIALKSSNETKYWLYLLRDSVLSKELNKSSINFLLNEAVEISNMLGSALLTMKNKRI